MIGQATVRGGGSVESPGLPPGRSLTITAVERDDYGIRINYEIVPPLERIAHPLAARHEIIETANTPQPSGRACG
jgi:hypothetical protein